MLNRVVNSIRAQGGLEGMAVQQESDQLCAAMAAKTLKKGRVSLCAHLGYPAAVAATDSPNNQELGTAKWLRQLTNWGAMPPARASYGLAKLLQPIWRSAHQDDALHGDDSLELLARWIQTQDESIKTQLQTFDDPHADDPEWHRPPHLAGALAVAQFAALTPLSPSAVWDAGESFTHTVTVLPHGVSVTFPCDFQFQDPRQAMINIIGYNIVPWALGYFDPFSQQMA